MLQYSIQQNLISEIRSEQKLRLTHVPIFASRLPQCHVLHTLHRVGTVVDPALNEPTSSQRSLNAFTS